MNNKFIGFSQVGLLVASCLFGVQALAGVWEDFGKIVSAQVAVALKSNPTDKGRLNLLKVMEASPDQLGRDLISGIPEIDITVKEDSSRGTGKEIKGLKFQDTSVTILQQDLQGKSAAQVYKLVAEPLVEFLREQNVDVMVNENNIGPFVMTEILSGLNQKFNAITAFGKFALKHENWLAKQGQGRIFGEIIFVPLSNSIVVKLSNIQTYTNMETDEEKNLTTISFTTFNLTSGTVTFKFSYKFGAEEVFWAQENPVEIK